MPKSQINLEALEADFEKRPEKAFSRSELFAIFNTHRFTWNLPRSMTQKMFVDVLLRRTKMSEVTLASPHYEPLVRYVWGAHTSPLSVSLSIKRGAFCSHGSAMWIHNLGGDERSIFVNSEQSEKAPNRGELTQDGINRAFRNAQRQSKLVYKFKDATITVLSGKNSGRLEVGLGKAPSGEAVEVTSIERTLIDIAVRPSYAGGITKVLEGFRRARGKVSVNKLRSVLKTLDYTYPFHQSIGFYIKRSGYPQADQDLMRQLGTHFNFYLGYALKNPDFDPEFRVFFPNALT